MQNKAAVIVTSNHSQDKRVYLKELKLMSD